MRTWMSDQNRGTFFAATGGLIAITLGSVLAAAGRSGGLALALVGIFFWAIAGTANRWQHLVLRLFGAQLEAKLGTEGARGEIRRGRRGCSGTVCWRLSSRYLREDAASHVLELGEAFDGKRLLDPELSWLRKERQRHGLCSEPARRRREVDGRRARVDAAPSAGDAPGSRW